MPHGAPEVDSSQDASIVVPEIRRGRVVVRRRRARGHRHKQPTWAARASRRKIVRGIVVCASVLVLMGLCLYYGLSRAELGPNSRHLHTAVASAYRA
jgi:hypothetical protein